MGGEELAVVSLAGVKWVLYSVSPSYVSVTIPQTGQVGDIWLG